MKRLPWAALVLIAGTACANLVFVGCGSDSNPDIPGDAGDENANVNPPPPTPPNPPPPPPDADVPDVILDGSRDPDATVACLDGGPGFATCTSSTQCCTRFCALPSDGGAGNCAVDPTSQLLPPGSPCTFGPQCTTGSCVNGTCSSTVCEANGLSCANSTDCCSQNCVPQPGGGGKCQTLAANDAGTTGTGCTTNSQCASSYCKNGVCANPSFCVQNNDICSTNTECCGGLCVKAAGNTVGVCGSTPATGFGGCNPAGTLCGSGVDGGAADGGTACDQNCCSHSCGPYLSTAHVCEPPGGCKPTGEICKDDKDCCGASPEKSNVKCDKSRTTNQFGRCNNGNSCTPAGGTCKVGGALSCSLPNNCCEPHTLLADGGVGPLEPSSYCNNDPAKCCRQDVLGIPRCLFVATDCSQPVPNGTACASAADCCGKPCVGGKCGTTCVGTGGACTSTSDCCPGLPCAIAPGSTSGICGGTVLADGGVTDAAPPGTDGGTVLTDAGDGGTSTCSLYGQTCTANSDCCNGVPCDTMGTKTCHFP